MSDLIRLQTKDWELSIWCKDISQRQKTYSNTIGKRNGYYRFNDLRFTPALQLIEADRMGQPIVQEYSAPLSSLQLTTPIFFENLQYHFEWVFLNDFVDEAAIQHRLDTVNKGFRFVPSNPQRQSPARLIGVVNTANDVGWFRLPLSHKRSGQWLKQNLSFEVIPTKVDLHHDLQAMYRCIDQEYPLWRFSLAEKTEQEVSKSDARSDFSLLWLANFQRLREELEVGLKVISAAPHSRLQTTKFHVKTSRLKGRISPKLAQRVISNIQDGHLDRRYLQEKKRLSVDTQENRFIKMIVTVTKKRLIAFHHKLLAANQAPQGQRLSDSFLNEIKQWQSPLANMQKQAFMSEVGNFSGQPSESLVLQQKTGYSAVYRAWQELKYYLDVFAAQATVSMKSVADIYEVWCFLSVRKILVEQLGFTENPHQRDSLRPNAFYEYQLLDGMMGAFKFARPDGVLVRLAHEPPFQKDGASIRTYLIAQKPDILLEVTWPNDKKCIWLFDAKYRIKPVTNGGYNQPNTTLDSDLVPDDAINQMHRYRDALISTEKSVWSDNVSKSRSIFGAFALYPGYYDQTTQKNPYAEAIEQIGIGAFALLPSADNTIGNHWLSRFLVEQIGTMQLCNNGNVDNVHATGTAYNTHSATERLLVKEAARIPHHGMEQVLYPELVMIARIGDGREDEYITNFEQGHARFYHIPVDTISLKYSQHIIREVRYLAISHLRPLNNMAQIDTLWPVLSVCKMERGQLNQQQTGVVHNAGTNAYWLFELGTALALKTPIKDVPINGFRQSLKLTTLESINGATSFYDVAGVYEDALVLVD